MKGSYPMPGPSMDARRGGKKQDGADRGTAPKSARGAQRHNKGGGSKKGGY